MFAVGLEHLREELIFVGRIFFFVGDDDKKADLLFIAKRRPKSGGRGGCACGLDVFDDVHHVFDALGSVRVMELVWESGEAALFR